MTGLISLLSFHRCAALSCGDRGQRANVWFLAHVHCHCIESRPQEWRRCRRCSAEAFQRGSTHNNTSKKKDSVFSDRRGNIIPYHKRVQLKSGCDVTCGLFPLIYASRICNLMLLSAAASQTLTNTKSFDIVCVQLELKLHVLLPSHTRKHLKLWFLIESLNPPLISKFNISFLIIVLLWLMCMSCTSSLGNVDLYQ